LNDHWFLTMGHARRVTERWRIEYNTERPHSSLGDRTPEEFAAAAEPGAFPRPAGAETARRVKTLTKVKEKTKTAAAVSPAGNEQGNRRIESPVSPRV
jgi:hypothetical protein